MADVVFLTGVDDKLAFACRLLRKKHREGARVAIFGPPPLLQRLDQALWADPALDFVPHLYWRAGRAPPDDAHRTPLWLLDVADASLRCDNAVNLGINEVETLCGHSRVAEIISLDEADRAAGQQRWKRYKALGHTLTHRPQNQAE
jgi:DNA polymerase III subunit chi